MSGVVRWGNTPLARPWKEIHQQDAQTQFSLKEMDEPFVFFKKFCSAFFSFFFLNLSEKHICQWLIKKYFSLQTHKHQKLSADVNMLWMCYFDAPWLFFWPPLWTITHIWEWMCCKACHSGGIWSFLLSWIQIKAKNVRQHPEHKKE